MIRKILSKLHTWETFLNQGLRERTTYVGLAIIIFGWLYYREINILIINILTSPQLVSTIISSIPATLIAKGIDSVATIVGAGSIIYKSTKIDVKKDS